MSETHTYERACAVIVGDEDSAERINEVRKVCDPAYPRWMPHINLLYPFLGHSATSPALIRRAKYALAQLEPFTVEFDTVSSFSQRGGRESIHLHPNEQSRQKLRAVFSALLPVFGTASTATAAGFEPHLTIAVWPVPDDANLPKTVKSPKDFCKLCFERFKSIKVPVKEIVIIDRHPARGEYCPGAVSSYKFKVQERMKLGGMAVEPGKRPRASELERRCISSIVALNQANASVSLALRRVAVQRAAVCLKRMTAQRKLPRTRHALEKLLQPFTKHRMLLDMRVILANMTRQGCIAMRVEKRKAPAGTAAEPPLEEPRRTVPNANLPRAARGRGRGRGAMRAPPPPPSKPARPLVETKVVALQRARVDALPQPSAAEASKLIPYGPDTASVIEHRTNLFLKRFLAGMVKRVKSKAAAAAAKAEAEDAAASGYGEEARGRDRDRPDPRGGRGGRGVARGFSRGRGTPPPHTDPPSSSSATAAAPRPVRLPAEFTFAQAGFERLVRDVCTVPCLVPVEEIIADLHASGAVKFVEGADGTEEQLVIDATLVSSN